MAINGILNTGQGPVYVNQKALENANIHSVFVASTVKTGQLSQTLSALTSAATGTLLITGSLSATLGAITLSATGTLPGNASLSVTLGDATSSGAATLAIAGAGSDALAAATLVSTGSLRIQGSATVTLDAATLAATATLLISGSLGATLDALTLDAAGTSAQVTEGTLAATLDDATLSAAATLTGGGLTQLIERAKGAGGVSRHRRRRKRDPIAIAARLWIRLPRLQAVVELSEPIEPLTPEGELRGRLPLPTLRAIGVIGARGRALLPVPLPSIESRVFVAPCGDARLVVLHPVMRAHVRGRHDHFTDKQIERAVSLLLVA